MSICPNVLFNHLLEDVLPFDRGRSGPDATRTDVAVKALKEGFLKKFEEAPLESAETAALEKFLAVNERGRTWTLEELESWDYELLGLFKQQIYKYWNSIQNVSEGLTPKDTDGWVGIASNKRSIPLPLVNSFGDLLQYGRTGPGAALEANASDFYSKMFSSRLTMTASFLLAAYRSHFDSNPRWTAAEKLRSAVYGELVVRGNKLGFAPKNRDIHRVTCTEPSVNMFYQLGLGAVLERRNKQVFDIDPESQPFWNRKYAKQASIDGRIATLDLRSASDSMFLRMLRTVLPVDFMSWLELLRSPVCRLPDGTDIDLHMVSTMGNGYTFPLQTMLFSCAVAAVYEQARIPLRPRGYTDFDPRRSVAEGPPKRVNGNFAVWGDDIVCDSTVAHRVIRLLELLGFEVNADKTFLDRNDPFRESCGYDYHNGEDVRAVYCKKLADTSSRFALVNRLNRWSASQGIPLPKTVGYLMDSLPVLPVPRRENDDAGVKVPLDLLREKGWYYETDVNNSFAYRRFEPRPVAVSVPQTRGLDDAFKYPPSVRKKKMWNPEGLHIAWLGGYIRSGKINVRTDTIPYRTRWAISCNWDAPPDDPDRLSQDGWSRWASATAANVR